MAEQMEESPERLARPLVCLASMMGVATSYTGLSRDFHEISDETLVAILGALGIDATSDEAIEKAIADITRERHLRLIDPTVLHTVGKETHVTLRTGITEPAQVTLILENGEHFEGELRLNAMPEAKVHEIDGKFIAESELVLPAELPVGYHTLHVESGERSEDATLISAPERIEMLDPMKNGSLWGWMAQLASASRRPDLKQEPTFPEECLSYTEEELNERTTLRTDIDTYLTQSMANFIMGVWSLDSDWDTYLETLKTMRLEDYLAIEQAAWDRYIAE